MPLAITCDSPPVGEIGIAYSHFFPVTGDVPPDIFSITMGSLPAGLTLNTATGEVSGIPLGPAATSPFTIQVTDSLASAQFSPTNMTSQIAPSPYVVTASSAYPDNPCPMLPTPCGGGSYSPYLPFSSMFGAPTWTGMNFGVCSMTLDIGAGNSQVLLSYSFGVNTLNRGPQSWVYRGSLDDVTYFVIDTRTGVTWPTGTPQTFTCNAGNTNAYRFFKLDITANVSGSEFTEVGGSITPPGLLLFGNSSATAACSITIVAPPNPSIICDSPPSGQVGDSYSHAFPASSGVPPYTNFSKIAGTLPNGLVLNSTTGVVSGIPTVAGLFSFTIQVMDSLSHTASVPCSILIAAAPPPPPVLTIICGNPPNGVAGVPYSALLPISNGVQPYTVRIIAGFLPPDMTITDMGQIMGVPRMAGTYPFAAQVTDAVLTRAQVACSITITFPISPPCPDHHDDVHPYTANDQGRPGCPNNPAPTA